MLHGGACLGLPGGRPLQRHIFQGIAVPNKVGVEVEAPGCEVDVLNLAHSWTTD
jgi:hypothetical protein